MRRRRMAGAFVGALVVASGLTADALAGPSNRNGLERGDGVVLTGEEVTTEGAVIDTYASRSGTVKVIGRRGSSVSVVESLDPGTGRRTASIRLAVSIPKTGADADAHRRSERSTVGDLVALGMPRDQAIREFGDMDAPSAPRGGAQVDGGLVASASATPPRNERAPSISGTTPYDTVCASLSYESGKITGYGCSTLYLVAASGGDWWFDSKYKFSAHSSDGSIFRPQRLFEVGWSLSWAANNIVYDWQPETTIKRNDCGTVGFSLFEKGVGVSVAAPICPSKIGPWNLGSTRSGSLWQGIEQGQAYEAAIGVQAVHSPPNAAASYESPFKLVWGPFPP
jgi:hypothetical protein